MSQQAHSGAGSGGTSSAADTIAMARVVGSAEAAAFCNYSLAHWLRLTREGKVPAPVRLGARKLGWRLGQLVAFTNQSAA